VADVEACILHRPDDSKPRTNYLPLLELAVRENPQDARMWTYLARERWFRGDHDGMLRAARTALFLPGWPAERAALCRWVASGELAEEWLIRGTIEAPNEAEAWYALARFHHDRADWSGCLTASKRGLCAPPRPEVHRPCLWSGGTQGQPYRWATGEQPHALRGRHAREAACGDRHTVLERLEAHTSLSGVPPTNTAGG